MLDKYLCLEALAARRTNEIVITTMSVAEPWARLSDTPLDFASVESAMGHAADFALGLALARPDRRFIVLNGDGSTLMCLGTLVTIAQQAPRNLALIIVENGTYEVTGNQPVPGAGRTDFGGLARAAGIRQVCVLRDRGAFAARLPMCLHAAGPVVQVWQVEPAAEPVPRPQYYIRERTRRLRRALAAEASQ
jgi:thiamine pyrophosphate-dependent acetolactate synthase large subunit-like protein